MVESGEVVADLVQIEEAAAVPVPVPVGRFMADIVTNITRFMTGKNRNCLDRGGSKILEGASTEVKIRDIELHPS